MLGAYKLLEEGSSKDPLRRNAYGEFADEELETAFKGSFFRNNLRLHMLACFILFRPDAVFQLEGFSRLTWTISMLSYFSMLPLLVGLRLWANRLKDHDRARHLGTRVYLAYSILTFGADIVLILVGIETIDKLLPSMTNPKLTASRSLAALASGMLQGSHALSFPVNAGLCLMVAVDNLLNGYLLVRGGHGDSVLTLSTGMLAFYLGIGSMHAYESVLRTNYVAAQVKLRAQEQLASYLFHEVRNHQNAQAGVLELVSVHIEQTPHQPLPEATARMVDEAKLHALNGQRVISNMLDFTKLRAGKHTLRTAEFDIVELLGECITLVRHISREKPSVHLDMRAELGALPTKLLGPSDLLKQVLINLLTNALKYTSRGHVLLRAAVLDSHSPASLVRTTSHSSILVASTATAEVEGTSANMPPVVLSVEDTGCGIPINKWASVFEPYEQGDKPGTGLGLPFCKCIVEEMGSKLILSQHATGGSIFSFRLQGCRVAPRPRPPSPVEPDPQTTSAPVAPAPPGGVLNSAPRLLVADDFKVNRVLLCRLLKAILPNAIFTREKSGEAALATLTEALASGVPFDIAFLDEHYAGQELTGTEVTRRFRQIESDHAAQHGAARRLVIVGCSADVYSAAEAQAAGQDLAFGKPYPEQQEMKDMLSGHLPAA